MDRCVSQDTLGLDQQMSCRVIQPGTVYLVGAGPGDPDLLTMRAFELLQEADLVLYDNLTSPEVLAVTRPDAEQVYVGKKRASHVLTQAQINERMIAAARDGKSVVRLKGGDPYVFGRGGEEVQAMTEACVPVEVIPGVTSALGVAAYAGIPLTHRDHTQILTMLTGHDVERIDWKLQAHRQTIVIFMGLTTCSEITRRLILAGLDPHTPAVAVRWGTRGDQVVIEGMLSDLSEKISRFSLKPPALVIIGEVVRLREQLNWFDRLPLRGQSIVVTREAAQGKSMCHHLRRLGAQVVSLPTIAFKPPASWLAADQAIQRLPQYDWLIFTSVNGVNYFLKRLDASPWDLRQLPASLCAIGPATADRLRKLHLNVELIPEEFVAESLAESFAKLAMKGQKILLPRAQEARDLLPDKLLELGAQVDVVPVYQTVLPESSLALAASTWGSDLVPDWVTVTSPSTVRNLAQIVPLDRLKRSRLASIGPITSLSVRELGLNVKIESSCHTTEGLVEALCAYCISEGSKAG